MPKTRCYCGLKSIKRICKYVLIMPLIAYTCKKKCMQEGVRSLCTFFHNHNHQGGTGKFIYKVSILDNKQLLSSMTDCIRSHNVYKCICCGIHTTATHHQQKTSAMKQNDRNLLESSFPFPLLLYRIVVYWLNGLCIYCKVSFTTRRQCTFAK